VRMFRYASSAAPYWTVIDRNVEGVPAADRFLREERIGRDRVERTAMSPPRGSALGGASDVKVWRPESVAKCCIRDHCCERGTNCVSYA
jgi:hypothetical protein